MQLEKKPQKTDSVFFEKIDLQSWHRKEIYLRYLNVIPCTFSMTVNIDISKVLSVVKLNNYKLFPVLLYSISSVVNAHKEFCMGHDEQGNLGYYEVLHPSCTIFHEKTEMFTSVWVEYNENCQDFYKKYALEIERYKDDHLNSKPQLSNNFFNVSCIPWVNFTGFNLNLQKGYNHFSPIFTIGKYGISEGKTLLPLAIQVHHSVCDGFHVARFINELQEKLDTFTPESQS